LEILQLLGRTSLDNSGVRDILLKSAVLRRENVASAMELINSIQNGTVPELALRDARAALLNDKPSSSDLSYWKTIAEGCYEEYGPAVYEFQRAYYTFTGQMLESQCGLEYRSMPLIIGGRKPSESFSLYSVAPSVTSSQVRIIGLEESIDISVVDLYGRTVMEFQELQPNQQISLGHLPASQYLIVFDSVDHEPLRVIVQ